MERLEQAVDKLVMDGQNEQAGAFLDEVVMGEVLDLPAQVGDDVCVLCDVVGHAQQVTLDLVAGRNQGQGLWLPWERLLSCDGNTQARFIRKTQISPLSLKGEGWRLKREGSDTCYHMGGP